MNKTEVAVMEVRNMVEDFKKRGLPAQISIEEALPTLTNEQKDLISQLFDLSKKEQKVARANVVRSAEQNLT